VGPNILILVLDAARRDALEPYGAPTGSSPAIAQLASRGTALPEVYATACWTVPSHTSFFSGLMPRAAGVSRVGSPAGAKAALAPHHGRMLPEVLGSAGYATAGASANLWVSESSGFAAGFDSFVSVEPGRHARFQAQSRRGRLGWLREAAAARVDDGARPARAALEGWIADAGRRPFFLFANVVECHSPYLPPRPYGDVSLVDRLRAGAEAQRYYSLDGIWRACVGGFDMPPDVVDRMRRLYRGAVRYMDDWVAGLLEHLDRLRLLDETLVVVLSDHGENLGEGGLLAHAFSLDNRLIHVPLVLAGPGSDGAAITSLAELPGLVAGVAGVECEAYAGTVPPGIGIAQFDPPAGPDDPTAIATVERWGLGDDALRRLTTPLTAAVAGDLKLVRAGEREEVYDLAADPLELAPMTAADLAAERHPELARLREALAHPAVTARREEERADAAEEQGASAAELREIEERMKLLGYM
jgi:arylsulfatase A-like enzyme